jgi:hypothetical protein
MWIFAGAGSFRLAIMLALVLSDYMTRRWRCAMSRSAALPGDGR